MIIQLQFSEIMGCAKLTPGVLLPPDHRHEFKIVIPITLLDMTTITVIDHGMSLSVLYDLTHISCPINASLYSPKDKDSSHMPTSSGVHVYTLYAEIFG
jgi:hypothetical protein